MQRDLHRHFISYSLTALMYVVAIYFIFQSDVVHIASEQKPKEITMQLSLSTFVPEVKAPVQKVVTPKEKIEPEVKKPVEEEPTVKEQIAEKPIIKKLKIKPLPKKVVQKKIKKKKVKKRVVKKPTLKKQKPKRRATKSKKTTHKKLSRQQASKKRVSSTKGNRSKFLSAIRAKIERNKFYPRIAKRRGMQGDVRVEFTILANGNVKINSAKGAKIFANSARNAVKKAFPIDAKKAPIALPETLNVTLHYRLR